MNKAALILLLVTSACAHATTADDSNSAVLENIARLNKYEQTAKEMSNGKSDMVQISQQQYQKAPSQPQVVMPTTATSSKQTAAPTSAKSSVYQSIKILIESGNLTEKDKMKLISALSS
ncbi:hypothetical protein L1D34_11270 [Vibrio mediterranei]|uniref:hypothetical protein n=1 Tax=Vibrio mediterranei TaxID=689 RepID=UPI001EFC573A|nr:hypothetical protein [Vibrio mediterranei]MCG9625425.1 hypothetical protein [Vibrio mediterranei]